MSIKVLNNEVKLSLIFKDTNIQDIIEEGRLYAGLDYGYKGFECIDTVGKMTCNNAICDVIVNESEVATFVTVPLMHVQLILKETGLPLNVTIQNKVYELPFGLSSNMNSLAQRLFEDILMSIVNADDNQGINKSELYDFKLYKPKDDKFGNLYNYEISQHFNIELI